MKITLLVIGKTNDPNVKAICSDYLDRIKHYSKIEYIELEPGKHSDVEKTKEEEGKRILKKIADNDFLILLDDKGKEFTSVSFAGYLESLFNQSLKGIIFVIGGAFGFSKEVYLRSNVKLSLSKMTFSHQIIRPLFLEQLYRAFTIMRNEKYHHE